MGAVRLARAVTGREIVVKFAGAYHGHSDGLLADAGSGMATPGDSRQPGGHRRRRRPPPSSSPGTTARRSRGRSPIMPVAALLAEPIAANMGVVPPEEGFLEFLREATRDGRRAADLRRGDHRLPRRPRRRPGALRGRARPDRARQGARRRPAGGGLRRAARERWSGSPRPATCTRPGTLSGNPLAVAAGLATLRAARRRGLRAPRRAHRAPRRRAAELAEDRPLQVASAPGLLTLFFSAEPVTDFGAASACDLDAHARFCRAMLDARGLPAAVPVRGLVRLPRPRRGQRRPHPGSGGGVPRRGAAR